MKKAKYYIYRNLHKPGCFSVRYKGKVIEVSNHIIAEHVEFKISKVGQNKVRKEKRKNVHAFAVTDVYYSKNNIGLRKFNHKTYLHDINSTKLITYNPYTMDRFQWKSTRKEIKNVVKYAVFIEGKVHGCS